MFTVTETVPCPRVTMTNPVDTLSGHVDSKVKGKRQSQGTRLQKCIEFVPKHSRAHLFLECETQREKRGRSESAHLHYHVSDHIKSAQEKVNTIVLYRYLEDRTISCTSEESEKIRNALRADQEESTSVLTQNVNIGEHVLT